MVKMGKKIPLSVEKHKTLISLYVSDLLSSWLDNDEHYAPHLGR